MATTIDDPEPWAQEPGAEPEQPQPAVRVRAGELVSAACALGLLVLMFAAKWYGVAGVPDPSAARPAVTTAENGWDGLTLTRWVLLATIVAALGAVLLHVSQREHGAKTDTGLVVAVLGAASSALLIYRVLLVAPDPSKVIDQKLGAVLALGCALGIALGGYQSVIEERERARTSAPRHRRRSDSETGGE